ncbi:hypothetical protein SBA4_7670005 [Candidatus Sulfopaludibacter sp. SbA4]|nr:hypothetical protein SBA4_7670005 [Candidatus Sulfopaludibacter sp. SbA4]
MRTPAIIRTPPLTAEELARRMGMPRSRVKEIFDLADSIVAKWPPEWKRKDTKRSASNKKRATKTTGVKKKK